MDEWGECSGEDDEENVENMETGDRGHLSRNGGGGEEGEVCAATIHDVNHTSLQLFDSIMELANFLLTAHCCLMHLSPDFTLKDFSALHEKSGNADGDRASGCCSEEQVN